MPAPSPFPSSPAERVHYSMAKFSRIFAESNLQIPTKDVRMKISCLDIEETRYMWTACILFGLNTPHLKFGKEVIYVQDRRFSPDNELEHSFLWWGQQFKATSLYQTVFKTYLTPQMFVISKSTPLYENIPGTLSEKEQIELRKQHRLSEHEKIGRQPNTQPQVTQPITPQNTLKTFVKESAPMMSLEQFFLSNPNASHEDVMQAIQSLESAIGIGNFEAALQLAQFYQVDHINIKKDLNRAVGHYMQAAKLGCKQALGPLEALCEQMSPRKQFALSQFYASIFNQKKATLWDQKATESEKFDPFMS